MSTQDEQFNAALAFIFGATYLLIEDKKEKNKRKRKSRSVWVRNWVKKREVEGCYSKLLTELRLENPSLYKNFLRMNYEDFNFILDLVAPKITKYDTVMRKAIPPGERLALTLRYLATGETFTSLQYVFRIPQNTISTIIPEVCSAIYSVLKDDYLKVPSTQMDWKQIAKKFEELWHFPHCLGAVDGKHVVMKAPPDSGSIYYNYKGTHSIVFMGIADAEYKLSYIDIGINGRISDGGVFRNCSFHRALNENKLELPIPEPLPQRYTPVPYVLVADDAFALKPNMMKPFSGKNLNGIERVYNYRLSRCRRIIENVFGIMSARFRVLRQPIQLNAEKTKKVTQACCALHNFLMTRKSQAYNPFGTFDRYDSDGAFIPGI